MSIRTRTWTNVDGSTGSAFVVNWTPDQDDRLAGGSTRRRLKTFQHMREAKAFHALIDGKRPTLARALRRLEDEINRGEKFVTIKRVDAETIVKAFRP